MAEKNPHLRSMIFRTTPPFIQLCSNIFSKYVQYDFPTDFPMIFQSFPTNFPMDFPIYLGFPGRCFQPPGRWKANLIAKCLES